MNTKDNDDIDVLNIMLKIMQNPIPMLDYLITKDYIKECNKCMREKIK